MTVDAILHIGSITKIFNATLLMQLVEEGRISLDKPAIEYLPDLRLGDVEALHAITVEQLVNHTSGIDANLLPDAGHDEETIEKTVQRSGNAGQLHAPGAARSYCNAGTVIAGYLCQRVAQKSWYDLVKERIFQPLEMDRAVVLPEDALLHRCSVGHSVDAETGKATRTRQAFLPLGFAPAGSTAMMSATNLLAFVNAHLAGGRGASGKRILSRESAELMRQPSGSVTGPACFDGGIAWMLLPDGLVHHGGGGPGILSWFVAHPSSGTILVILTNGENGFKAINDIVGPFFASRFGIQPFPAPRPVALDPGDDLSEYAGSYENNTTVHEIHVRDGRLSWNARAKDEYADASPLEERAPIPLVPSENRTFFCDAVSVRFTPPANGHCEYLIHSYRMHRRIAAET